MPDKRIQSHPVLEVPAKDEIAFTWNGMPLTGSVSPQDKDAVTIFSPARQFSQVRETFK